MTRDRLVVVARTVTLMKDAFKRGRDWDAFVYFKDIENLNELEEILYIWNQLEPRETNIIKEYQKAERDLSQMRL